MTTATHDTVLDAGSVRSRIARVYAEALLSAAVKQGGASVVDSLGTELGEFVTGVLDQNADSAAFLGSPAVGKKAKAAALTAALSDNSSELFRGLLGVLARNGRLDLLRGVSAAYRQILDDRAGRVRVKVSVPVELTDAQRDSLTKTLADVLKQQPVLDVRVDPDLLGGMVVQVGDRVIDTSVRTRLQTLRTQLLDGGTSYVRQ